MLSDRARRCDGALVPLRIAHIEGLAAGDRDATARVAEGFEQMGAWVLAAEAWAGLAGGGASSTRGPGRAASARSRRPV